MWSFLTNEIMLSRGVHGSGKSSLCPTRNRPVRDQVGRFSTRNWPFKRVGFHGLVCQRVASVSGEVETRRKTQKNCQNQWDLARSSQDLVRISSNPMIFPPNRAENCRIWCIYAESDCFGHRNLPNQAKTHRNCWRIRQNLMSSGKSGFKGFERGDSKLTCRRRVLELKTRGRPSEQSDRVNAGRVRAGWASGRVGWTALMLSM